MIPKLSDLLREQICECYLNELRAMMGYNADLHALVRGHCLTVCCK